MKLVNSVITKIDWKRKSILKWLDINVMYKNIVKQTFQFVNYHYIDNLT